MSNIFSNKTFKNVIKKLCKLMIKSSFYTYFFKCCFALIFYCVFNKLLKMNVGGMFNNVTL